jgi:hypothetical protein
MVVYVMSPGEKGSDKSTSLTPSGCYQVSKAVKDHLANAGIKYIYASESSNHLWETALMVALGLPNKSTLKEVARVFFGDNLENFLHKIQVKNQGSVLLIADSSLMKAMILESEKKFLPGKASIIECSIAGGEDLAISHRIISNGYY